MQSFKVTLNRASGHQPTKDYIIVASTAAKAADAAMKVARRPNGWGRCYDVHVDRVERLGEVFIA